jgi:hypothetical protein
MQTPLPLDVFETIARQADAATRFCLGMAVPGLKHVQTGIPWHVLRGTAAYHGSFNQLRWFEQHKHLPVCSSIAICAHSTLVHDVSFESLFAYELLDGNFFKAMILAPDASRLLCLAVATLSFGNIITFMQLWRRYHSSYPDEAILVAAMLRTFDFMVQVYDCDQKWRTLPICRLEALQCNRPGNAHWALIRRGSIIP